MMSSRFLEVDEEAELKQSFQVFDRNGNVIAQFSIKRDPYAHL